MIDHSSKLSKILAFIWYVGIVVFCVSCQDDDLPPECGCESPTLSEIPNEEIGGPVEEQTTGFLYYKKPEMMDLYLDDPQYNNHFWIFQGTSGCYNCQRHLIICNENILTEELKNLRNNNDSVPIVFTGEIKRLCTEPFIVPADFFYSEIKLNTIQRTPLNK